MTEVSPSLPYPPATCTDPLGYARSLSIMQILSQWSMNLSLGSETESKGQHLKQKLAADTCDWLGVCGTKSTLLFFYLLSCCDVLCGRNPSIQLINALEERSLWKYTNISISGSLFMVHCPWFWQNWFFPVLKNKHEQMGLGIMQLSY